MCSSRTEGCLVEPEQLYCHYRVVWCYKQDALSKRWVKIEDVWKSTLVTCALCGNQTERCLQSSSLVYKPRVMPVLVVTLSENNTNVTVCSNTYSCWREFVVKPFYIYVCTAYLFMYGSLLAYFPALMSWNCFLRSLRLVVLQAKFELVTSEASYIRSLNIAVDHFMMSQELTECLGTQDRQWLFSKLPEVRGVSERYHTLTP